MTDAPSVAATDNREYIHRIDATDNIIAVNSDWLAFAKENDAPAATLDAVGTSLWTHISGIEVQYIYRMLLRTVREYDRMLSFPFCCNSPTMQRMMHMTMVLQPGQEVEFRSRVIRQRPTEFIVLFDTKARMSSTLLGMCSWCQRVRLDSNTETEEWVEPHVAIARLDLFADEPVPRITHSLCPSCAQKLFEEAGLTGKH